MSSDSGVQSCHHHCHRLWTVAITPESPLHAGGQSSCALEPARGRRSQVCTALLPSQFLTLVLEKEF